MRTRIVALAVVGTFAVGVAAVAVVAGGNGDGSPTLRQLSFGASQEAAGDRAGAALAPFFTPGEYRVGFDLPDLGGEAPAYSLPGAGDRAAAARLAERLGLAGEVGEDEHSFLVRGSGGVLQVSKAPGVPWSLARCAAPGPAGGEAPEDLVAGGCATQGVVSCVAAAPEDPDAQVACDVPAPAGEAPGGAPDRFTPERVPGLPTRAEADRAAREVFERLGVGTARLQLHEGFDAWEAVVEPGVGGLRTIGRTFSVGIGPGNEVVRASGFLAEPQRIGDYPLVSTTQAFERLREGRFPGGAVAIAEDQPGDAKADCSSPTVMCDPPPLGALKAAEPPQPVVRMVTGVELALLHMGAELVPVYLFRLDDGGEMPVPAVTDEWIADQPHPEPAPLPAPAPRPEPTPAPLAVAKPETTIPGQ